MEEPAFLQAVHAMAHTLGPGQEALRGRHWEMLCGFLRGESIEAAMLPALEERLRSFCTATEVETAMQAAASAVPAGAVPDIGLQGGRSKITCASMLSCRHACGRNCSKSL